MNFVSCVKWVKQGLAKHEPDKVGLSEEELKDLLENAEKAEIEEESVHNSGNDEYDFSDYDEEDETVKVNIKGIAVYDKNNTKKNNESDSDSEKDDELIKPDDNLIIVGHIDGDQSALEIYVYNDNDGDLYIHHDIILSNVPLCIETLYSNSNSTSNNLCIMGGMDPVIEVWDLDIVGCVEPAFKLGRKKKKNSHKNYGHTDTVLDLSWNHDLPHILASGSVDNTALLWDLDNGNVSTTMTQFTDKVQSITWNPLESYSLLVGSADNKVRIFDCRVYDEFQKWKLDSSVEQVTWNTNNSFVCFAGTEQGYVYTIDRRKCKKPLYHFLAHEKEITGLRYSNISSDLLITCSADENFKIWDISKDKPHLISAKNIKLDSLQCLDINPDLPYLCCVGGTSVHKNSNMKVLNMNNYIHTFEDVSPDI